MRRATAIIATWSRRRRGAPLSIARTLAAYGAGAGDARTNAAASSLVSMFCRSSAGHQPALAGTLSIGMSFSECRTENRSA